jgi:hypothetical protein
MWGLSSQPSLLQRIHQSLIFRDQFWASLLLVAVDFKEPAHQLGEVLHDFLQGLVADTIRNGTRGRLVKSDQVGVFSQANSRKGLLQNAIDWLAVPFTSGTRPLTPPGAAKSRQNGLPDG